MRITLAGRTRFVARLSLLTRVTFAARDDFFAFFARLDSRHRCFLGRMVSSD